MAACILLFGSTEGAIEDDVVLEKVNELETKVASLCK